MTVTAISSSSSNRSDDDDIVLDDKLTAIVNRNELDDATRRGRLPNERSHASRPRHFKRSPPNGSRCRRGQSEQPWRGSSAVNLHLKHTAKDGRLARCPLSVLGMSAPSLRSGVFHQQIHMITVSYRILQTRCLRRRFCDDLHSDIRPYSSTLCLYYSFMRRFKIIIGTNSEFRVTPPCFLISQVQPNVSGDHGSSPITCMIRRSPRKFSNGNYVQVS